MASTGPAAVPVIPPAAGSTQPMALMSPEPKRPRQRDLALPTAMTRDVTLPEPVAEFAELHHRFGRNETFATGMHDALNHNALLLGAVLESLPAVEGKLGTAVGTGRRMGWRRGERKCFG